MCQNRKERAELESSEVVFFFYALRAVFKQLMMTSPESCRQGIFSLSKAGVSLGHAVFFRRGSTGQEIKEAFFWSSPLVSTSVMKPRVFDWLRMNLSKYSLLFFWSVNEQVVVFIRRSLQCSFFYRCFALRLSGCSLWLTHWVEGSNLLSFLQHLFFKCSCYLCITYTDVIVLLSESDC